jgi:hypothetical protein
MAARKKTRIGNSKPAASVVPTGRSRRGGSRSIAQALVDDIPNSTSVPGQVTAGGITGSVSAAQVVQDMHGTVHAEGAPSESPRSTLSASGRARARSKIKAKRRRPS